MHNCNILSSTITSQIIALGTTAGLLLVRDKEILNILNYNGIVPKVLITEILETNF